MASTERFSRLVEEAHILSPSEALIHFDWLPDGRTSLVFREFESGEGDISVAGPRTLACRKRVVGVARAMIVPLRAGWVEALFDAPVSDLVNRIVPLSEFWGTAGAELYRSTADFREPNLGVRRIAAALANRVDTRTESASVRIVRRAVARFAAGATRVRRVASELGVTERHLRRVFTKSIGIGPKVYARNVRFRRAVELMKGRVAPSDVAFATGFCDQAHLSTEFRALCGVTPREFLEGKPLAPVLCS